MDGRTEKSGNTTTLFVMGVYKLEFASRNTFFIPYQFRDACYEQGGAPISRRNILSSLTIFLSNPSTSPNVFSKLIYTLGLVGVLYCGVSPQQTLFEFEQKFLLNSNCDKTGLARHLMGDMRQKTKRKSSKSYLEQKKDLKAIIALNLTAKFFYSVLSGRDRRKK